ncbi:hypothetical protein Trydic_g2857 [Trypoxylus dichotomus]
MFAFGYVYVSVREGRHGGVYSTELNETVRKKFDGVMEFALYRFRVPPGRRRPSLGRDNSGPPPVKNPFAEKYELPAVNWTIGR